MTQAVAFDLTELPGDVYRVSNVLTVPPEQGEDLVDVDCAMTRDAAQEAADMAGLAGYSVERILGRTMSSGWWIVALLALAAV